MLLALLAALPAEASACSAGQAALDLLRMQALASAPELSRPQVHIAEIASSSDLGFSLIRSEEGAQAPVELLEIWKRTADCGWRTVAVDRAVAHGMIRNPDPAASSMSPVSPVSPQDRAPPAALLEGDAGGRAIDAFGRAAQEDGAAAAMHVYALDRGFHLSIDAAPRTEGTAEASINLSAHTLPGAWRESVRDRSADGTLIYAAGALEDARGAITRRYVQVWQYDPKVANFGLRVLFVSAAAGVR